MTEKEKQAKIKEFIKELEGVKKHRTPTTDEIIPLTTMEMVEMFDKDKNLEPNEHTLKILKEKRPFNKEHIVTKSSTPTEIMSIDVSSDRSVDNRNSDIR